MGWSYLAGDLGEGGFGGGAGYDDVDEEVSLCLFGPLGLGHDD